MHRVRRTRFIYRTIWRQKPRTRRRLILFEIDIIDATLTTKLEIIWILHSTFVPACAPKYSRASG